jgi:hypothetical protein
MRKISSPSSLILLPKGEAEEKTSTVMASDPSSFAIADYGVAGTGVLHWLVPPPGK